MDSEREGTVVLDDESATAVDGELGASDGDGELVPGQRVGRYEILEELGRGGMGVVYRAHDPTLDREVALKRLHPRRMGRRSRARLVREAQALARLSHPNVVAIYDVSTEPEGLLVAMEHVRGQTLKQWLRSPRRWADVLTMMLEAGEGLIAAHERGLVHRDFKPGNVIVGRDGRPRVLDFGLALLGDEPSTVSSPAVSDDDDDEPRGKPVPSTLTATGAVMGTPAYMAPEQHTGVPADARVDQFAFCVTLWEGLAGARPFDGDYVDVVAAKHRGPPAWPEGSPVPARIVRALVRGLSVSADDRWPSMVELLEALRPSARRWGWVLGLGATLVGVAGVLSWGVGSASPCADTEDGLGQIWNEERAVGVREALYGTELVFAREAWPRIEASLDRYVRTWRDERRSACEGAQEGDVTGAGLERRLACLERGRRALGAAVEALLDAGREDAGTSLMAVAELPSLAGCDDAGSRSDGPAPAGDPRRAATERALRDELSRVHTLVETRAFERALAVVERLRDEAQEVGHEPLSLEVEVAQARVRMARDDAPGAEAQLLDVYERARARGLDRIASEAASRLAMAVGVLQARQREGQTWAETAVAEAARLGVAGETEALAVDTMSRVLRARGEYAESIEHARRALEIRLAVHGPDHLLVVTTRHRLGLVLGLDGRYDDALAELGRAREALEATLGPGHPAVAEIRTSYGRALADAGRYDQAEAEYRRALTDLEAALPAGDSELSDPLLLLGDLHRRRGEHEQSQPLYERALGIREIALGPEHPGVAIALDALAVSHGMQGRTQEAERVHRRALRIRRAALDDHHPSIGGSLNNLALVLLELGRVDEAAEAFEEAVEIYEVALGPDHPGVTSPLTNLGNIRRDQGRNQEAEALHRRALRIRREAFGDQHLQVAEVAYNLGRALIDLGRHDEAEPVLTEVVSIVESTLSPTHGYLVEALRELGRARLGAGWLVEAGAALERAEALARELDGERSLRAARIAILRGRVEYARGHLRRATARWSEVARGLDRWPVPGDTAATRLALARTWWEAGEPRRAMAQAERAREVVTEDGLRDEIEAWVRDPKGPALAVSGERSRDGQ